MIQNLTKGKIVEYIVLLIALVALGLSIAAIAKPCSSNFTDRVRTRKDYSIGVADQHSNQDCPPGIECVCDPKKCSSYVFGGKCQGDQCVCDLNTINYPELLNSLEIKCDESSEPYIRWDMIDDNSCNYRMVCIKKS